MTPQEYAAWLVMYEWKFRLTHTFTTTQGPSGGTEGASSVFIPTLVARP